MLDSAPLLAQARERVRRQNGGAVGQPREELITPALVLDIDAAQRNIDRMASGLRQMGSATIRPHYKAHQSPDLAWRQVQAGAGGLPGHHGPIIAGRRASGPQIWPWYGPVIWPVAVRLSARWPFV